MKAILISIFLVSFMLVRPLFSQQGADLDYRINPRDVLEISVYNEPDLKKVVKVDLDGTINLPLLGDVLVSGLTPREAAGKIAELLLQDYLVDPQVDLVVKESARISVLGQVAKPGSFELKSSMTVLDAIVQAGGFVGPTSALEVRLVRIQGDSKETINIDIESMLDKHAKKDVLLKAGDLVMVGGLSQASEQIVLFGEVKKPGVYPYKKGMTVIEAVALAGGFTDLASPDGTKIIREENNKRKVIRVPLGSILKGANREKVIVLEPNDAIVVPQSFF